MRGETVFGGDLEPGAPLACPQHFNDTHQFRMALDRVLAPVTRLEVSLHQLVGGFTEDHGAWLGELLPLCRQVGRVAHRRVVHA